MRARSRSADHRVAVALTAASALDDEFARLRAAHRSATAADVVLLPPCVEVRHLRLPPLREAELRRVLARDASRYFPLPRGSYTVAVDLDTAPESGIIAAVATSELIDAIHAAASTHGFTVASIAPAYESWLAAAIQQGLVTRSGEEEVGLVLPSRTERMQLHDGRLVAIRRDPMNARRDREVTADAAVVSAARELDGDLIELAARFAPQAPRLALLTERQCDDARRRQRRALGRRTAATLLLLVATALVDHLGVQRELDRLHSARRAIAPELAVALNLRAAMLRSAARGAALDSLLTIPSRARALSLLASHLPADAHLVTLRIEGDSLELDAQGESAAACFQALRSAPGVLSVRTASPVRQAGDSDLERFTLVVRLTNDAGATAATTLASASREEPR